MPSIVLTMIERNEARVLPRSLGSFLKMGETGCDLAYAIVDGGSTDASIEVIADTMKDCLGHLKTIQQPQPLDDFSAARNAAIEIARPLGDWLFMLDADDEIVLEPGFQMPDLDAMGAPGFAILVRFGHDEFYRPALVKSSLPWHYEGELHEHIECPGAGPVPRLNGIHILVHPGEGSRSADPRQKFLNDAAVLAKALEKDPTNPRNLFYYAQSLRDAGDYPASLSAYERRGTMMGAWDEETYFALLQCARLKAALEYPKDEVQDAYLRAHNFRPGRAESLGFLSEYLRLKGNYSSAAYFSHAAMQIPKPSDVLFVGCDWYEWRAEDEFAVSCFYLGDPGTARVACQRLLNNPKLPASHRDRVAKNLAFAEEAIARVANPVQEPVSV